MIVWKTINDAEGQEFGFAYPKNEIPTDIRRTHYKNSRLALKKAAEELTSAKPISFSKLEDFEIVNHHHLKTNPNILVSLAHTRGLAAAACTYKSQDQLGIGIDCESENRIVKEVLLEKFATHNDHALNSLHLWCAKEAAFKAASSFWKRDKTFVLKDITVKKQSFTIDELGHGELHFHKERGHLICVATLKELF